MANKIFALIGPHASGKSTFALELIEKGVNYIPYYTTELPPEGGEKPERAKLLKRIGKMDFFKADFIAKDTYKGNYYGIKKSDLLDAANRYPISLVITTPVAFKQLAKLMKDSLESIYLMCDYVTLVERMLVLGHNNEQIKYHLEYAENNGEFDLYKTARHVVKNTGDAASVSRQLMSILGLVVPAPAVEIARLTQPVK